MDVRDLISEWNEEALMADGFDEAILGISQRVGMEDVVAYDRDKCISVLMDRDGMSQEDAVEYFEFNVAGAYMGENTPVFISMFPTAP
jgi:hypothetical protein|tara:strand:- start:29 stop:292 length:264 start_codon:yes stop_codon:yes gene_type:complete